MATSDREKSATCKTNSDGGFPLGLLDICTYSKAVFISKVDSDEEETLVRQFIKNKLLTTGTWNNVDLPDHRVLFSSSHEGRVSMVRQLEPTIHIETVESVAEALKGKIPNLVYLGSGNDQTTLEECASVVKELSLALDDPL